MDEKRSTKEFLEDAEKYRQHRLHIAEFNRKWYGAPYNSVEIDAETCERIGIGGDGGYRCFQYALQTRVTQLLDRLLRVKDRLPSLIEWADEMREENEKLAQIADVIRDPRNWMEWIATGKCEALRVLPPGLISVKETELDPTEIPSSYKNKGQHMWEEAEQMAKTLD